MNGIRDLRLHRGFHYPMMSAIAILWVTANSCRALCSLVFVWVVRRDVPNTSAKVLECTCTGASIWQKKRCWNQFVSCFRWLWGCPDQSCIGGASLPACRLVV